MTGNSEKSKIPKIPKMYAPPFAIFWRVCGGSRIKIFYKVKFSFFAIFHLENDGKFRKVENPENPENPENVCATFLQYFGVC